MSIHSANLIACVTDIYAAAEETASGVIIDRIDLGDIQLNMIELEGVRKLVIRGSTEVAAIVPADVFSVIA